MIFLLSFSMRVSGCIYSVALVTCLYVWNNMQMEQYGGLQPMRWLYSLSFFRLGGRVCHK